MVLAPPSARRDGAYKWIANLLIADAPQWLVDLVTTTPKRDAKQSISYPPPSLEEVGAAVGAISNPDLSWDEWCYVGMAIYAATAGSDEGFEMFEAFSKKSKKYTAEGTKTKWHQLSTSLPNRITVGSIFWMANRDRPEWRTEFAASRRADQIVHNREIGEAIEEPDLPTIMTLAEMEDRLIYIGASGAVADRVTLRV